MRKALMATSVSPHSPRQMSVVPPESSGMSPRFLSPVESTAEVGSRAVALHTLPKAFMTCAFRRSIVGCALTETMGEGTVTRGENENEPS